MGGVGRGAKSLLRRRNGEEPGRTDRRAAGCGVQTAQDRAGFVGGALRDDADAAAAGVGRELTGGAPHRWVIRLVVKIPRLVPEP
ncbi:hypothetical protein BQ8482_160085 [Mesorhizobium delmotii]|uniref:Uncharacterized protein n=1 Tax=Mesorhizobium delmotii TaxID=1631247 RepID=A0A2P9AHK9_9HYPH|nr:hypothetical protein BQ8482_160085 [Mesorhizobium delmotii]